MLCSFALRSYEKYGTRLDPTTNEFIQRGLLVNYDSLPGYFPQVLLPLFGISPVPNQWIAKIKQESEFYSKSRGSASMFKGDSKDKDERATDAIQKYADSILQPTYELLNKKALEGIHAISPLLTQRIVKDVGSNIINWKEISELPDSSMTTTDTIFTTELQSAITEKEEEEDRRQRLDGHSEVLIEQEFKHWLPFANHHSSKSFSVRIKNNSCNIINI